MSEKVGREYSPEDVSEAHLRFQNPVPTGGQVVLLKSDLAHATDLVAEECRAYDSHAVVDCFGEDREAASFDESDVVVYEELNIAVIAHRGGTEQSATIASRLSETGAVDDALSEFYAFAYDAAPSLLTARFIDSADYTWGLQAIGVPSSKWDGTGIRVAVLDTGADVHHPDLRNKIVAARSFVQGEVVDDLNGHGTHCSGTVAGAYASPRNPQYAVAPEAALVIGKVLSNRGSGRQRDIIAGIIWAVRERAAVISMSLGRATRPGEPFDPAYERAGAYALANDCLIVAAAGNESDRRFGHIAPVGAPANCPSIMAVAAVDLALQVADFSRGEINGNGGEVDVAAPGVSVFSSWPLERAYRSINGTSMACPHVAGVAALLAQSDGGLRGVKLARSLKDTARDIGGNVRDIGAGLVQAP